MSIFSKFQSVETILLEAGKTFKRFPYTLVCAIAGSIIGIYLVDFNNPINEEFLQKIVLLAGLGIPLFTALTVYAEKLKWDYAKVLLFQILGVALLFGYYFTLPAVLESAFMHLTRYFLIFLGAVSLVAFIAFLKRDQANGFWQFNKTLFLRLLLSALYSASLYIGLIMAMGAADYLFGADIDPERYFQLWILIVGVFNVTVFLAGIPRNLDQLNNINDYPNGLKLFTQYILLPLVALYFVILFAYEFKIIVTWNWPKGWVSQMVLWYSVVGIFSLLIFYPLRDAVQHKWIKVFSKSFFWSLIPLIIMLAFAIGQRVSDYGITVNRYFVIIMAAGLSVVTLYFLISKKKDIRIVPIVIFAIALFSAFGPWGAFSTAERCQSGRLDEYLIANKIMVDDQVVETDQTISVEDRQEMSSIINYLIEWHGIEAIESYFNDSALAILDTTSRYQAPQVAAEMFGFKYVSRWGISFDSFGIYAEQTSNTINIQSYDYILDLNNNIIGDSSTYYELLNDTLSIVLLPNDYAIRCFLVSDSSMVAELELDEFLKDYDFAGYHHGVHQDDMTFYSESEKFGVKFIFDSIYGNYSDSVLTIGGISGKALLKIKE